MPVSNCKLLPVDVKVAKRMFKGGFTLRQIAKFLHVHPSTIHDAITGKSWDAKKHELAKISHNLKIRGSNNYAAKLTEAKVKRYRKWIAEGKYTQAEICRKEGISTQLMSLIKLRKIWRHV